MSITGAIRTLIVDDEAPARSRLRHLLNSRADFTIIGECVHGQQAVEAIRSLSPEVVLLDVQMPRLDGFQVCAAIGPQAMPAVVFVTAYDRFALQAFEVHAVDYLLKPVDQERFRQTLDRLRSQLRGAGAGEAANERLVALLAEFKQPRALDRLAIKVDGRLILLRTAEIDWLEAEGNYVRLHSGTADYLFRDTLSALEAELPAERFVRISRSVIVNLDCVREFQRLFYGDHAVLLRNGKKLTLSRTFRDRVEKLLTRPG